MGLVKSKGSLKYLFINFGCAGSSLLHELFSSCGEQGNSLVAVAMQKLLIAVASFVAEHGFSGVWASVVTVFPPLRRQWHPTPVLLPRESHGQRSLVGCNPWGP